MHYNEEQKLPRCKHSSKI